MHHPNSDVTEALAALHAGAAALTYEEENVWHTDRPEHRAAVDTLRELVADGTFRGSALLATDKEILWASGSGQKDTEGRTVTPLTTFEIGSLTKAFTACLIFRLIEAGKLALTDRVTAFFPAFTQAGEMTVSELLHMRSGIVDFANDAEAFFEQDEAQVRALWEGKLGDEELLAQVRRLPLTFEPGTKEEYCNTNYVLLALIAEKLTGKSWRENVEAQIFGPLGMDSSSADTWGDVTSVPEGDDGYMKELHTARGAGDIHAAAPDLLRFDRALFGGGIVGPESLKEMLSSRDSYGCGWFCGPGEGDMVTHTGGTGSYLSLNTVFHPQGERRYLIMLSASPEEAWIKAVMERCKAVL